MRGFVLVPTIKSGYVIVVVSFAELDTPLLMWGVLRLEQ